MFAGAAVALVTLLVVSIVAFSASMCSEEIGYTLRHNKAENRRIKEAIAKQKIAEANANEAEARLKIARLEYRKSRQVNQHSL